MDYKDLGMRVRTLRRQMGFTQEELAEKVGISASFLGHIERGTRVASLETLVAMCNTLCVSPEYFLQSSLNMTTYHMPQGLSSSDRAKLTQFLRLAEDAVQGWEK